ncbi:hypothetical protein CHS0354_028115 [Potamilus streckersoni]|uniref:Elongator complex protein 6 n=1 Tax=Potamilus streckersoni TaxID=2493646 RepID=A0AAE0TI21_9BIVA|nr:hypothetical protein CHS0354_028115 [Potamilus streckersoni]
MFSDLNHLFAVSKENHLQGEFVVISNSKADGSFLIHHFLSFFLKQNRPVCFVGLSQSYNHYSTVAQKLSCNLNAAKTSGQLVFIEGMKLLGDAVSGNSLIKGDNSFVCKAAFDLQQFFMHIKSTLELLKMNQTQDPVLIIDNLSFLLYIGCSIPQLVMFVNYLLQKVTSQCTGSLVLALYSDMISVDENSDLLWKNLSHLCSITCQVTGLESGYSKDVHGELLITWRSRDVKQTQIKKTQFKLSDKNVTFFASGMSSAVL